MNHNVSKQKTFALLNLAGFILMIVMNFLANYLPVNNKTTGELSDLYPNLFVPAGFTFAIWGIIYLLLLIFVIFQLNRAFQNQNQAYFISKIGYWFLISCVANASWILAWHHEKVLLSLVIMLILFFSLITIYNHLNIGTGPVNRNEKYMLNVPFSIYFAWINVAIVANVTVLLVDSGWGRFGLSEQFWTITILGVITVITLFFLIRRKDLYFSLVILWAFYGILNKRMHDTHIPDSGIQSLLLIGMALIILVGIVQQFMKKVY
jgi:hypothetical protein